MTRYQVTKKFLAGLLAGLEIKEVTTVRFAVGFTCEKPIGGSPYIVTACTEVR